MKMLTTKSPNFEFGFATLLSRALTSPDVTATVHDIIARVRREGDAALLDYTEKFDHLVTNAAGLRISQDEIHAALASTPQNLRDALQLAARRIETFHRAQLPKNFEYTDDAGMTCGLRWGPLDAVGIYVPGGKASYPSSVLMNAIPAKVAGVRRVAMCVPSPHGELNPLVLAAAGLAGVSEIYRVGGAQAIAALAYGTETIRKVDRITGPGNAYVAEAKRQVFGTVGIDSIAGPSEVLILADDSANPKLIALDLLAQAEHDEDAQSILITTSGPLAAAVQSEVDTQLGRLSRAAIAAESWHHNGGIILVKDWDEAITLANRIAAEHVQLMVEDPARLFQHIRHAGAIFLGHSTPEALGDYVAGPNHVLPTSGTARFASGLGVYDFLKRTTFIAAPPRALDAIGPAAIALANAEGLTAHALSVEERMPRRGNPY